MFLLKKSSSFLSSTALALILCLGISETQAMDLDLDQKWTSSLNRFTESSDLSTKGEKDKSGQVIPTEEELLTAMLATAGKFYEHEMMTLYPLTPEGYTALYEAVERGDEKAQDELMRRYERDIVTEKDIQEKIKDFFTWTNVEDRITSRPGYARAYFHYYSKRDKNFSGDRLSRIQQSIEKAARAGNAQALYNQTIIKKPSELREYYEGAVKNDSLVSIQIGEIHLAFGERTDWCDKDYFYYLQVPDSDTLIRRAALAGDPIAQLEIAKVLVERKEKSVRQKAVDILRVHAEKGNREALFRLGKIDVYKAPRAEDGSVLYMMGKFYGESEDRAQVFAESVQRCLQAYNLGHPEAGEALSLLYRHIRYSQLQSSFKKEAYQVISPIYRQLAGEGKGLFQVVLAYMLADVDYVAHDDVEAMAWFKKAVNNPSTDESDRAGVNCDIAEMYEFGRGVKKDLAQAFEGYGKSNLDEAYEKVQNYITGKPVKKESPEEEKTPTSQIHPNFVDLEERKLVGTPNLGSVTLNSSALCVVPHFAGTFSKFEKAEVHLLDLSKSQDIYSPEFFLLTEIEAKRQVPGHLETHTFEDIIYVTIGEANCRIATLVMTALKSFVEIEPALLHLISSCQKAIEGFDAELLQLSAMVNAKSTETEVDPLEAKLLAKAKVNFKLKSAAREALAPDYERLVRYHDTSDKLRNYVTVGARARNEKFFEGGFEFLRNR